MPSTTHIIGEEDITTSPTGEEEATTHAIGEEGAGSTDAIGEEEPVPGDEIASNPFGSF